MSTRRKKRYLKIDALDEVSGVDVPAQEGARIVAIGKSAALVLIDKAMTCPECGAQIEPDGDEDGDEALKAHLKRGCMGKRDFSADERREAADNGAAMPDGSYPIKTATDLSNAIKAWGRASEGDRAAVARHIKGRAKSLGLTDKLPDEGPLAEALGTAKRAPQENTMAPEIDDLKKRAEQAETLAKTWQTIAHLPEAQRGYCLALPVEKRGEFLALSAADRAKASEPIFVSKSTGDRYFAHDDHRIVEMAKREDARAEEFAKMRDERDDARFAKQADEVLEHSPGSDKVRVALIKAVTNIADEKIRGEAIEALRAGDRALAKAYGRAGRTFAGTEQERQEGVAAEAERTPDGWWDAQVAKHQSTSKIEKRTDAEASFLDTDEGRQAYKHYEQLRKDALHDRN